MENNTDAKTIVEKTDNSIEKQEETKTYTQEEIDKSFKAGAKKARKEFESSKDYKDFLEWQKTNQNDSEKINELQSENSKLKEENNTLKATNKVAKSDVKPEFLKFVTSEVMALVDDTTDFDTALSNYKKNNSQYFGEVVVKKMQSSRNLTGGAKPQSTNDIVNSVLRGAIGK